MLAITYKLIGYRRQVQFVNHLCVDVEHHCVVQLWLTHCASQVTLEPFEHGQRLLTSCICCWKHQE